VSGTRQGATLADQVKRRLVKYNSSSGSRIAFTVYLLMVHYKLSVSNIQHGSAQRYTHY